MKLNGFFCFTLPQDNMQESYQLWKLRRGFFSDWFTGRRRDSFYYDAETVVVVNLFYESSIPVH